VQRLDREPGFAGVRYAPAVWLVAIIALNWSFGVPRADLNFRPSGNLASGLAVNRAAFAVSDEIARAVSERREWLKVIIGRPNPRVLRHIDFVPAIEVEMASRASAVHAASRVRILDFIASDGSRTRLVSRAKPKDLYLPASGAGYYSPWGPNIPGLNYLGFNVVGFDPDEMYKRFGSIPLPGRRHQRR
jgi:hypothetical protein